MTEWAIRRLKDPMLVKNREKLTRTTWGRNRNTFDKRHTSETHHGSDPTIGLATPA